MKIAIAVDQPVLLHLQIGKLQIRGDAKVAKVQGQQLTLSNPLKEGTNNRFPFKPVPVTVMLPMLDALYTVPSQMVAETEEGVVVSLSDDSEIQRIQRRDFHRVPAPLVCLVEVPGQEAAPPIPSQLRNLSGGGCGVFLPSRMEALTELKLTIEMPGADMEPVTGRIVHLQAVIDRQTGRPSGYWGGVKFDSLGQKAREHVMRYVFEAERQIRRSVEEPPPLIPAKPVRKETPKEPRWPLASKRDAVLRMIRGEAPEALAQQLGLNVGRLQGWHDHAMSAIDAALREAE